MAAWRWLPGSGLLHRCACAQARIVHNAGHGSWGNPSGHALCLSVACWLQRIKTTLHA